MRIINIYSLLFSYNTNFGNTNQILDFFITNIKKEIAFCSVSEKRLTPLDFNIDYCKGCKKCFYEGVCSLDKNDAMKDIKNELLNNDLIILATPIYVNNIAGVMKIFIDRLASWTYLMKLKGVPMVLIITSSYKGIDEVCKYLFNIATLLGTNIIGIIQIKSNDSPNKLNLLTENIITRYKTDYIYSNIKPTNSYIERCFDNYKKIFSNMYGNSFESKYWMYINQESIRSFSTIINDDYK